MCELMNLLSPELREEVERSVADLKARLHEEDLRVALYIESQPEKSIAEAKAFVARFLGSASHLRYHWVLEKWDELLQSKSSAEIVRVFREGKDETEELRSCAPFCGKEFMSL